MAGSVKGLRVNEERAAEEEAERQSEHAWDEERLGEGSRGTV